MRKRKMQRIMLLLTLQGCLKFIRIILTAGFLNQESFRRAHD